VYTEEQLLSIWNSVKTIEGTEISAPEMKASLQVIQESRSGAKEYEWLYHCTTIHALMSIIEKREIWVSNLKLVNDKEEVGRIDAPEYEQAFYVSCFTYADSVSEKHWEEYSSLTDGVLVGFKRDWVERKAVFMLSNNEKDKNELFTIFNNDKDAFNERIRCQVDCNRIVMPFHIFDFGFYKVIYDNDLKASIQGQGEWEYQGNTYPGRTLAPHVAGIVKSEQGLCVRQGKESYLKDWREEKEIRLKIGIKQHLTEEKLPFFFPKIAVPLKDKAFDELQLHFSPDFGEDRKAEYLQQIEQMLS
jgi:hypothetical protein